VKNDDAAKVSDKLVELGGTPETHDVSDQVEAAAASAAGGEPSRGMSAQNSWPRS
jgi:hypothetical protein